MSVKLQIESKYPKTADAMGVRAGTVLRDKEGDLWLRVETGLILLTTATFGLWDTEDFEGGDEYWGPFEDLGTLKI